MAIYKISGCEELIAAMERIADLPDDVMTNALHAMADKAAEKIQQSGRSMGVYDPESDVHILDTVKKTGKVKRTEEGGTEAVTFTGSRTRGVRTANRTRNAEIAFINEYGKRGQKARPFIRNALEKNGEEITAPAEEIIGGWIENEFNHN